uniref:TFIIS central domain-containing protein n=1 Tax=Fagus sylvatica TaxID=28930 RepID=A0A2N9GLQ9_FAGSY
MPQRAKPNINDHKGATASGKLPKRLKIRIPRKEETPNIHDHKVSNFVPINTTDMNGYRERVRKQLEEAFSRVDCEGILRTGHDLVQVATSVESAMFRKIGLSNEIKKAKYQSVLFNLKDPQNPDLRRKVLVGEIEPEKLVTMTAEEMASHKRKGENVQIQVKLLQKCLHDTDKEE